MLQVPAQNAAYSFFDVAAVVNPSYVFFLPRFHAMWSRDAIQQ
jgi:hypothetical protein